MTDLPRLLSIAQEAVDTAARIIATQPAGDIHAKGDRDFCSDVDTGVQTAVRDLLHRSTPTFGFLAEEGADSTNPDTENTWVLDPLDGTSNFIHGIPLCGISLGLFRDGVSVLGIIDLPFLRERYWATHGHGAFDRHGQVRLSERQELKDAIVSIGDYAVGVNAEEKNRARLALTRLLAPRVERIRMFGSAAVDLTWLAAGRTNASISLSNNAWDMTAGVVITRESGARVIDVDGTDHTIKSRTTIATAKALAPALQEIVLQAMEDSDIDPTSA